MEFYVDNNSLSLDQMLNKRLDICEPKDRKKQKWCGIGDGAVCFDIDATKYPCPFVTPMTFSNTELLTINTFDFLNNDDFVDIVQNKALKPL